MPMPPFPPAEVTHTWNFSYGTMGGSNRSGMIRNIGLWTTLGTFFSPGEEEFWFNNICDYTAHLEPGYLASLAPWTVDLESFPFINRALLSIKWVGSFDPPGAPQVVPLPTNPNNVQSAEEVMFEMGIFGLPDFYDVTFRASVSASNPLTELHVPFYGDAVGANPVVTFHYPALLNYPLPFIPNDATATLVPGDTVGAYELGFDVIATKVAWWWKLPEKDPCGERQPQAPYIYTPFDPSDATGYKWEKYDPEDSDAHPTPVILSIEPNHGRVQGNEPIVIRGDGFGTEATVTFDGIPVLEVEIISQSEIHVRNPPHAGGYANVVVTNFDGVSS
jgi:IPT/TIG domain